MNQNKKFYYGILKDGDVVEFNSDNAFYNKNINYLIKGDFIRKTHKGFSIFGYSIFKQNLKIDNQTINFGNLICKIPKTDIWGSVSGKNHNGVIFKIIINEKIELTFPFQDHSIEIFKEIFNLLKFLSNHNITII